MSTATAQTGSAPNVTNQEDGGGCIKPKLGLGFRFDTKYNEQTGLLEALNLGLEKFPLGTPATYYQRSDHRPKPDDESGWEGQQSSGVYFEDQSVNVSEFAKGTTIHVVFHFHDNYCDSAVGFLDRQDAERYFQESQDSLWGKFDEWRKWNDNYAFCVVKHAIPMAL